MGHLRIIKACLISHAVVTKQFFKAYCYFAELRSANPRGEPFCKRVLPLNPFPKNLLTTTFVIYGDNPCGVFPIPLSGLPPPQPLPGGEGVF